MAAASDQNMEDKDADMGTSADSTGGAVIQQVKMDPTTEGYDRFALYLRPLDRHGNHLVVA